MFRADHIINKEYREEVKMSPKTNPPFDPSPSQSLKTNLKSPSTEYPSIKKEETEQLFTTSVEPKLTKKTVSFHPKVRVILIPTRAELNPIFNSLYYSHLELEMCKKETFKELDSYRFSKDCLEKRDLLVKLGVFFDVNDSHKSLTIGTANAYDIQGTIPTSEDLTSCETDSECSSSRESIPDLLNDSNSKFWESGSPQDSVSVSRLDAREKSFPLPDSTFRYPVNLSNFDKKECSIRIASIILYQPFISFVSNMNDTV